MKFIESHFGLGQSKSGRVFGSIFTDGGVDTTTTVSENEPTRTTYDPRPDEVADFLDDPNATPF